MSIDMDVVRLIFDGIGAFFIAYLFCYTIFMVLSVTIGAVTLYEQRQNRLMRNKLEHDYYVPVSVIVPAHNESVTLADTVHNLLELDYRQYEIVVVDDGSTDDTAAILQKTFHMHQINRPVRHILPCQDEISLWVSFDYKCPITLVCKKNGGKADALNMGINVSTYPYVLCMDADSVLQWDSLKNIAAKVLETDNVVAVGGMIRVVNNVTMSHGHVVDYRLPSQLLQCMQVLEYDRSFLASRIFFDKFNGNLIISGAFGLFQKDFVNCVGGYRTDTMGEDMELVVRMHAYARANQIPYRILYTTDAVCWSQAPSNLKDLCKQRRRWHIGLFQSISSHRHMLFNPQYGLLSFVSFLYFTIYELLSPYIEVFGVISMAVAACFNLINIPYMLMFLGIYMVFNSLMGLTAFFSRIVSMDLHLRAIDAAKAVGVAMIENVGMRTILAYTRFTALLGYKRKKNDWGTIQRQKYKVVQEEQPGAVTDQTAPAREEPHEQEKP